MSKRVRAAEAQAIQETAETLLCYLEASDMHPDGKRGTNVIDNLTVFDGAAHLDDIGEQWGGVFAVMSDQEIRSPMNWVQWPIDSVFCHSVGADIGWSDGSIQFSRVVSCDPKTARGRVGLITPRMLAYQYSVIEPNGFHLGVKKFFSFYGGKWVDAMTPGEARRWIGRNYDGGATIPDYRKRENLNVMFSIASSIELTKRYVWSVCIGHGGPSVRFFTDPVGIREIFALRDIPAGRRRRAALRHWVRQHYRQMRADPAALAFVRRHLRGAVNFDWCGLRCRIEPAVADIEAAAV